MKNSGSGAAPWAAAASQAAHVAHALACRRRLQSALLLLLLTACKPAAQPPTPAPKAFGTAITEVGGSKQIAAIGTVLDQPVVVQVNDAQGAAIAGAPVWIHTQGATADPAQGLTGADGQFSATITLGGAPGRYQVVAATKDKSGKNVEIRLDQIALGYQQILGRQLNDLYCARCHDPESSAERVSNHDNLKANAHAFTDGNALNALSDADLASIIGHGGAALSRSAEMPPYGYTLSKSDIDALIAYIRALADPPYRAKGLTYATN